MLISCLTLEPPKSHGQVAVLSAFIGEHNDCISKDWELHALVLNILHSMIQIYPHDRHHSVVERNIRVLE